MFDLDKLKFINTSDALLQMKEWDRKRRNSGTVYMDALYNERTYVYWDLDNSLINEFIAKLSAISIKKKYEECILSSLLSAYSGYSRMYGLAEALIYISNWSQLLDD